MFGDERPYITYTLSKNATVAAISASEDMAKLEKDPHVAEGRGILQYQPRHIQPYITHDCAVNIHDTGRQIVVEVHTVLAATISDDLPATPCGRESCCRQRQTTVRWTGRCAAERPSSQSNRVVEST